MWPFLDRLWKDAVFLFSFIAAVTGGWELAGGAPTWINAVTAGAAALAAGWSAAPYVMEARNNG